MKTKEEILKERSFIQFGVMNNELDFLPISGKSALKAMQQYSDQNTKPLVECIKDLFRVVKYTFPLDALQYLDTTETIAETERLLSQYQKTEEE